MTSTAAPIERLTARAFTIPTDAPESDGTLAWDRTTLVLVEIEAGGRTGLGYSYTSAAAVPVIEETLAPAARGADAFDVPKIWDDMVARIRNIGARGVGACAISAADAALWDLKARLLDLPLCNLLGRRRQAVDVYGSGGFCSYSDDRLREQLGGWTADGGCRWVKMKVGRDPGADPARLAAARAAIGEAILFVDANGAFHAKAALAFAERAADLGVAWFEEPVSSDDLEGLRQVRDRAPTGMDIAAGEYGYDPFYFRRMVEAGAVDVLQADATRALGITGFLRAADIADAWNLPLSSHCAPAVHLHAACAAPRLRHMEWFHDHVRIESMLFDGAPRLAHGQIAPDITRPGLGLELKRADAEKWAV
ncbi:MAG TPA: enolase C-terminal domain-like protein [Caulobacteraceae bacterium]|jgi:L-alanine-DL-glutamate epimerase-like enolase superfamily enzyme|nr:enolase C-terminal domain-like protein [Caulobacteraceae bacterium]